MISKLDPALWSCQILIFIINCFILLLLLTVFLSFCVPPKERISVISKRNFNIWKVSAGEYWTGQFWALSVIFPRLRFAAERGHLSCCLNLLPPFECLAKGFVLAAFFFFFLEIMVVSESPAK